MSQHDFDISNADANSGVNVRAAINAALQALASSNSGAAEPATMYAYQLWADTTTGLLKIRNAANNAWVTIGPLTGIISDAAYSSDWDGKTNIAVSQNAAYDGLAPITHKGYDFLPIGWALDGGTPPAVKSTLSSTNKIDTRDFSGTSNEDVFVPWQVPSDLSGTTVAFRVLCFVPGATPPAENEVIAFSLAGASIGNSELLSKSLGTAVTSNITCASGYAQYDRVATAFSGDVTITDLLAGETAMLQLIRLATSTDTYAQDIGVFGIEIKYTRTVSNA